MRGTFIAAIAAALVALVFAGKPAAATPAAAALAYGETNAGVVEKVGRKYRYGRKWRRGPYYRGYAYRPYYWGRPYYRPYWGPYGYYGYGWPYWRRPGFSFWFGF